jgi:hypothetical protein
VQLAGPVEARLAAPVQVRLAVLVQFAAAGLSPQQHRPPRRVSEKLGDLTHRSSLFLPLLSAATPLQPMPQWSSDYPTKCAFAGNSISPRMTLAKNWRRKTIFEPLRSPPMKMHSDPKPEIPMRLSS